VDRTTIEFINGSAFSVDSEGLIIPVIQKGKDIEIDFDVLNELKRSEYREEIDSFIKANLQAILDKSNHIFVSESKDIKANKIILVKFNSDDCYGPDAIANLSTKLREALEFLCSQNVVTISIPQLLKLGNVSVDQNNYCDEVSKVTCEFAESMFNRLNRVIFASPNRKLVEDLAASFKKAASNKAKNPSQSLTGTITGDSVRVTPTEQKPMEPTLKSALPPKHVTPKKDLPEEPSKVDEALKQKDDEAAKAEKLRLEAAAADAKRLQEEKEKADKELQEAEKRKKEAEEAEKKLKEADAEAEKKRLEEEAEKKRKEEEEERKRKEEEAEKERKKVEEEAELKGKQEEEEKKKLEEEAEKKRLEEEAERLRLEEEAKKKQEEEEAEKKQLQDEAEAERKRQEEEAEIKRKLEEEEEAARRKLSEEAKRTKEEEEEAARKLQEEAELAKQAEDEKAKSEAVTDADAQADVSQPPADITEEKAESEGQSTEIGEEIKEKDGDEAAKDEHDQEEHGGEEGKKKKKKKGKK
jgi:hypothetical protein